MEQIKVLIVEDHEATSKGLVAELSSTAGIAVVGAASTSADGLKQLAANKPDVVLLDLHLPDSKGPKSLALSFCEAGNAKVIVFSGDGRVAIRDLILKCGVSGYLLKSESIDFVVKAVKQVMIDGEPVISQKLAANAGSNHLTKAEEHLLTLIARGMKYKDIARERFTAPETVRKQIDQILEKLDLDSREELIAWAVENGYANVEAER